MQPTWFDDKVSYRFFREFPGKISGISAPIGNLRAYSLNPAISRLEDRKKKIKALSFQYGEEYVQRLLYFHLSLDRFLRLKMPINRISFLLNETYLYFERYLYMNLNWDKGEMGYYRDHSLHAANEAFLGYEILSKLNQLENRFLDFFKQNNELTRYIDDNCRIGRSKERLKHIIYRTWFISSLFHDLGYVLSFGKDIRDNILNVHRHSDLIFRANRSSFNEIQLLLGNSLLFNTVEHKKLEESYNNNQHGTLSAFLLLATFYSPSSFENIDVLDRVAIELAAHAIYYHDSPDEKNLTKKKKREDDEEEMNPSSPKPLFSGKWSKCFKKSTAQINGANKILKLLDENKCILDSVYKIDPSKLGNDSLNSKRISFQSSPFAFYLRFIDELHVFGRNSFSINTKPIEKKRKESPTSFLMPHVRNIVNFPAQIIACENNNLKVYFVADASLYSKKTPGKKKNPYYDHGHNRLDEKGIGYFLNELYWLQKSNKESRLFKDLEFYFIESWPKEQNA